MTHPIPATEHADTSLVAYMTLAFVVMIWLLTVAFIYGYKEPSATLYFQGNCSGTYNGQPFVCATPEISP